MPTTRRNYLCHCIEGGVYMGGMAFVSAEVVLPPMIESLGGSPGMMAIIPTLLLLGFMIPGVFVAPLIDRLPRFYPTVMGFGLLQRLPYLVAGILLLYLAKQEGGNAALWAVFLTPLIAGLLGGIPNIAWMELVTRMVAPKRRAGAWATRWILAGLIGISIGPLIANTLEKYPGVEGFGRLHLYAFALIILSYLVQLFMRETDFPEPKIGGRSYLQRLAGYPSLLRGQPRFRWHLLAKTLGMGLMIAAPFLTSHALAVTERPPSAMGYYVTAQNLGLIGGNLFAGWFGDRFGGRKLLIFSRLFQLFTLAYLALASTHAAFLGGFFLFGASIYIMVVGDLTLGVEILPKEDRPYRLALQNLALVPGSLGASWVAATLWSSSGNYRILLAASALSVFAALLVTLRISEPRQDT